MIVGQMLSDLGFDVSVTGVFSSVSIAQNDWLIMLIILMEFVGFIIFLLV